MNEELRKQFADDKIVMASVLTEPPLASPLRGARPAMPFGRGWRVMSEHLLSECLCENRVVLSGRNAFFVCYLMIPGSGSTQGGVIRWLVG